MNKSKIKICCSEANHVCDKSQYKEASLFEKIKLNIHLIYCKACRHYTKNNIKLSQLLKNNKTEALLPEEKQHLQTILEKELTKQNKQ